MSVRSTEVILRPIQALVRSRTRYSPSCSGTSSTIRRKDGSFGNPVHNTFAPLALLASGDAKYLPAVKLNVDYHCRETYPNDRRYFDLINWTYMSAAIVLSEYYLATGEKWVLPELQEVYDHLAKSQYLHMSQINPKAKKSHPDSFPKGPKDSHGGWGHNPGFEGYGPIAMLTGQGALAYSLMHRCGIKIDRVRHDAAYEFLKKGNREERIRLVWRQDRRRSGRLGRYGPNWATGIANFLSPYAGPMYRERALSHAKVIGKHPQSFPDTHGSPAMGMAYTALAANVDPESFRKLMDANRWWFTMAQCTDGSFYYQPNRDNAGYGPDSRMTASSVVAFIFTIPKHSLVISGKEAKVVKTDDRTVSAGKPVKVFILAGQSNMEGKGFIKADPQRNEGKGSLEYLTKQPATAEFVIAETGMSGKEEKHRRALSLMKAQAALAEYEEFKGNVAFVGTREFWRDGGVAKGPAELTVNASAGRPTDKNRQCDPRDHERRRQKASRRVQLPHDPGECERQYARRSKYADPEQQLVPREQARQRHEESQGNQDHHLITAKLMSRSFGRAAPVLLQREMEFSVCGVLASGKLEKGGTGHLRSALSLLRAFRPA